MTIRITAGMVIFFFVFVTVTKITVGVQSGSCLRVREGSLSRELNWSECEAMHSRTSSLRG